MKTVLTFTGDTQIDAVFRGLPLLFQHRVLQAGHADAAKPLVEKEKQLAQVRFGRLRKSIGVIRPSIKKANEVGEVLVGPRRGRFGGAHAHLIEFGTGPRTYKGAYRGIIKAKPFAKPAFQSSIGEVLNNVKVSYAKKTLAFMRRTIKKNG